MTEELWYHALTFLDKYRTDVLTYNVDQLYEFADKTGVLERHRELLCIPYQENQVDMKIMYYELIKLLIDHERKNHPETYDATKHVGKIEGYQELTNKLQRYMNQKFLIDIGSNKTQIAILNQMFGGTATSINVNERFEALEQTNLMLLQEIKILKEQDASMLVKIKDLEERIEKNEEKTVFVENRVNVFETAQTATNISVDGFMKNLMEKDNQLQVQIDKQEEITISLTTNDIKQDERLTALENQGLNFENKLSSLESTDLLLQEANRQLNDRIAFVEMEAKRIEEKLELVMDQQQEMIDDKLKAQIADLLKAIAEINQDKDNIYERLGVVEDHDVAHEARIDALEKAGLEATKKLVLEIEAKMKGYDETSTDRLKKAEADIKTNADNIALLDEASRHATGQITNIFNANVTIKETIQEMNTKNEDEFNGIKIKIEMLEEANKNSGEKLVAIEEHQYVQNEKVTFIQQLNEKVNKIDDDRQESVEKVQKDLDGLIEKNTKAIDELRNDYEENKSNVTAAHITINQNINSIQIKTEETWKEIEDFKNKHNVDMSNVSGNLDIERKRIDNILEELKDVNDDINNNKSDIKKNSDRLNDIDNVNINFNSKIDVILDENKNRDDQIKDMDIRITSNSNRIDNLETESQATLIKTNSMDEHLEILDKTVQELSSRQNDTDEKLQGINILANKIEVNVKNYEEELDKKSYNDMNDVRAQLEALQSDNNTNNRKIAEIDSGSQAIVEKVLALQQDLDGKLRGLSDNDNQIFLKIEGLENDNVNKNEKIQNLEDKNQNNIEKLVQIEEQTYLQAEKVHYVEMLSDRVNQIDDQRQKTEDKVKEEVDGTAQNNARAIEEMKKQLEDMIAGIEKQREIEQGDLKSDSDKITILIANLQDEGKLQKEKIQELIDDKLKLEDELEEAKKLTLNFQNTGENLKDSLIQYQNMLEGKLKDVEDETKDNTKRIMELEPETKAISAKILDLQNKNDDKFNIIKDELATENKELFGTLKNDVDDIMKLNEEKATEIDSHVDKLRELNKKLIDQVKEQMNEQGEHQDVIADELKRSNASQISDVKDDFEKRITLLFTKTEENQDAIEKANEAITDMNDRANKIMISVNGNTEEIDELKKNIDIQRELVVTKITEQKDTLENFFKSLEEKVEIIETTQIQEINRVEIISKQTEAQEKLAQQMEEKIKQVEKESEEHSSLISLVEKTGTEKREILGKEIREHSKTSMENIKAVRHEMEKGKDELWTLIVEIYSTFRGYTVVLKSEGAVRNHQADTLGVYRMVDSYNDRPVYKQDGGENYIYYSAASNSWLVGTVVGHQYGWLRNNKENAKDRRWIPDLRTGWEYKPLVRTDANLESASWATDDGTLRIEPLRDVEKVNELIRDIKNSKEID